MRPRGPYYWLAMILLAALALRVAAAVVWQQILGDAAFMFPDSESYWELGKRLAGGEKYEFSGSLAFRTPGYPLLLAPLFWLFGSEPPVLAARIVGAVLGTLAVGGIAWLTRRLFNDRAMLIAALVAAFHMEVISMSVLVLSEALFCPLMVAQLLLWTYAWQTRDAKAACGAALGTGLCAALAALTRPSWLLFTPLALSVSILIAWRKHRIRGDNVAARTTTQQESTPRTISFALTCGALLLAAFIVTMAPWWIRNYIVFQAFVPTSTEAGASLYDGLHARATGASDMKFVTRAELRFAGVHSDLHGEPAVRERELQRYLTLKAIEFALLNPARTAQLALIKFARTWSIWPNEERFRSWPLRLVVAAGYVPLLALGLFGAWRFAGRDFPYALCVLPAIYFSLLHMIFVGSIRYRQPAMLVLIVLAAGALDWIWSNYKQR